VFFEPIYVIHRAIWGRASTSDGQSVAAARSTGRRSSLRAGTRAIWSSLIYKFGWISEAALIPNQRMATGRNTLFQRRFLTLALSHLFRPRFLTRAAITRKTPPPELRSGQSLDLRLDQVALPLVIQLARAAHPARGSARRAVSCNTGAAGYRRSDAW